MLNQRKSILAIAVVLSAVFTSCSDDDSSSLKSSVSMTVSGEDYTLSSDDEFVYYDVTSGDDTYYYFSGSLVDGTDTVDLILSLPALDEGTYTLSEYGGDAGIYIYTDSSSYSTDGPYFSGYQDLGDYSIVIKSVGESTITGTFSGTLQPMASESTIDVSGDFQAIDWNTYFSL